MSLHTSYLRQFLLVIASLINVPTVQAGTVYSISPDDIFNISTNDFVQVGTLVDADAEGVTTDNDASQAVVTPVAHFERAAHIRSRFSVSDCRCRPTWEFAADAMWLRLERDRFVLIQEQNQATGAFVNTLSTNSIRSEYQPGFRLLLRRQLDECTSFEGSYFGMRQWSGSAAIPAVTGTNRLVSTGLVQSLTSFTSFSSGRVAMSSRFHNADFGVRRKLGDGNTSVLLGVRYMRFADDLLLQRNGTGLVAANSESTKINAENNMVGLQAGMAREIQMRRLTLSLGGSGSLLLNFNDASVDDTFTEAMTPATLVQLKGNRVSLAGVLDAAFTARWDVTSHLAIRSGYQILLASGVATAPGQMTLLGAAAVQGVGPGLVDTDAGVSDGGTLLLQGFFVGGELTW